MEANIVIVEQDLDLVMHLLNGRRKSMRYLTSADCVDIAMARQHLVDHDLWMEWSTRLLGFENLGAAFRAGQFQTPEEAE